MTTDAQPHLPANHRIHRTALIALWAAVLIALPIWMSLDKPGWDVAIYHRAVLAVAAGHDPYADAIAVQTAFHQLHIHTPYSNPGTDPPYSYVYSPITLTALRALAHVPALLTGIVYWLLYVLGVLAELWAGLWFARQHERRAFLFMVPVAAFFPGLLANGIVLSGNIAYILYGAMLLAAVYAWRTGTWRWFYLAAVAASCVKAPLLSLILLPALSARKQWLPAIATATLGFALFALQPLIWPDLFHHYLQAVELQFSYNRDFGCSPAGLFSGYLFDHGRSYNPASLYLYAAYALPLFLALLYLARLFHQGRFTLKQWVPVLLIGVILLNPRLIEYDVAPITLPLALIAWRTLRLIPNRTTAIVIGAVAFAALNAIALSSWDLRKLLDGPLLVILFVTGVATLLYGSRTHDQRVGD